MQIFVDADACPKIIRDIICRAAERTQTNTIFVANHVIPLPPSRWLQTIQVSSGFDVADDEIVRRIESGDLTITADIPLANDVIEKGGMALNPRGELYSESNIKQRLNIRDFMDTMRASGVQTGGPPPISQAERQNFANHLDSILRSQ